VPAKVPVKALIVAWLNCNVASKVPMFANKAVAAAVVAKAIEITPPLVAVGVIVPIAVVVTLPVVGLVVSKLTVITPPVKAEGIVVS